MIQIYLCDDDEKILRQIQTVLEKKILIEGYDMKVTCAASTVRELLEAVEENRQSIYFLDVDLKDEKWDGFRLGVELRRRDPHGILIYVTSYGEMAWRTFQYHLEAFDYIVKEPGQTGAAAARCLDAVHARLLNERRDPAELFAFRTGEEIRYVSLDDILFFETAPKSHHVFLHTAESRMDFVGSLGELENELNGRFVRIHRAYLAAWNKIRTVDWKESRVWIEGRECPLSRTGKSELKRKAGRSL